MSIFMFIVALKCELISELCAEKKNPVENEFNNKIRLAFKQQLSLCLQCFKSNPWFITFL